MCWGPEACIMLCLHCKFVYKFDHRAQSVIPTTRALASLSIQRGRLLWNTRSDSSRYPGKEYLGRCLSQLSSRMRLPTWHMIQKDKCIVHAFRAPREEFAAHPTNCWLIKVYQNPVSTRSSKVTAYLGEAPSLLPRHGEPCVRVLRAGVAPQGEFGCIGEYCYMQHPQLSSGCAVSLHSTVIVGGNVRLLGPRVPSRPRPPSDRRWAPGIEPRSAMSIFLSHSKADVSPPACDVDHAPVRPLDPPPSPFPSPFYPRLMGKTPSCCAPYEGSRSLAPPSGSCARQGGT